MEMTIPTEVKAAAEKKAYIITRAGDFLTVPLSEYDYFEANGHDAFTDYMKAVLYYDKCRRFDKAQSAKYFTKKAK